MKHEEETIVLMFSHHSQNVFLSVLNAAIKGFFWAKLMIVKERVSSVCF